MNACKAVTFKCFTLEQVKEINKLIKKNILGKEDLSLIAETSKRGEFSVVAILPVMELVHPFIYQCQHTNSEIFGYDIYWDFHLETFNYNVYGKNGEYALHIDATKEDKGIVRDIKLTCLLNLSEEPYEGGEFYMISSNEKHEFTSGMGIVFNSMMAHRVTPVTKGERITLTYWAIGPSWR